MAMLISPILMFLVPFCVRRRCRIKAGLSRQIRLRYQLFKVAAILMVTSSFAIIFVGIAYASSELTLVGLLSFVPLFWGGFAILILFSDPLTISKFADGLFWLRVCA